MHLTLVFATVGINPCLRSTGFSSPISLGNESDLDYHRIEDLDRQRRQQQQQQLSDIGLKVLKRFFDSFPLRLSTYIVQRVVLMRDSIKCTKTEKRSIIGNGDILSENAKEEQMLSDNSTAFFCPICSNTLCIDLKLKFKGCNHEFCELCFWGDLLSNIDSRKKQNARDVVVCLLCGESEANDNTTMHSNHSTNLVHADISHLSPIEKSELSLEKFHRLPLNQRELKSTSLKKKKLTEIDHLASNWIEAVVPSLGSTQDIRRDKFLLHVERNAFTYVKGCLLLGVDINMTNEYGQSALYVAAWRGYIELVRLLLHHGADASIPANGGSTILSLSYIANHQRNSEVLELLDSQNGACSKIANPTNDSTSIDVATRFMHVSNPTEPKCTELIKAIANHPGAGSCFIDNALSSDAVEKVLELFHTLPVDGNQKKKKNTILCSERSYYCDAEGYLRRLLEIAVKRAGLAHIVLPVESVDGNHLSSQPPATLLELKSPSSVLRVFPHMRFLNYSSSGTVLPPHIDLCRVNPFCHPSQRQNPQYRSTHTFILYLTDCQEGGETSLLEEVTPDGSAASLAKVSPRKGRLLIFPHQTPHEGMEVVDVPKIILRGELQINDDVPL